MSLSVSEKEKIASILSESFLFKGIPAILDDDFLESCEIKLFTAGEVIFSSSSFSRCLMTVMSGKAAVMKNNTLLRTAAAGDIFGAASLFGGSEKDYSTTVYAKSKARVLFIPQAAVKTLISSEPQIALNYIEFLSDRVRFLNKKIDSFTSDNGVSRLAKYLLSQENDEFSVKLSYSKLAETLSIGRATLYRALGTLEESGIIVRSDKSITISKRGELEKLAKTSR